MTLVLLHSVLLSSLIFSWNLYDPSCYIHFTVCCIFKDKDRTQWDALEDIVLCISSLIEVYPAVCYITNMLTPRHFTPKYILLFCRY